MRVHSRVTRRATVLVVFVALLAAALVSTPGSARADRGAGYALNTHDVILDDSGKLVSWIPERDRAYSSVAALAWDYLLTKVPNDPDNGQPAYLSHSYLNTDTQEMAGWPHNPAGLYAMLIESAARYYQFSGDARVITLARRVADAQLANGMTASTDSWASVPYASGDSGSLLYTGSAYGNETGSGDGTGVIQPDKIGELGHGFVTLYKITGEKKYLDAAVQGANVLVAKRRSGNETQSPWPYRVTARDNVVKEEYGANVTGYLDLFDDLIELNVGNVAGYQTARTALWDWTMAYPMENGNWSGYFEDVEIQPSPSSNLNQLNAMQFARYLLLKPETDPSWEAHVRALIDWTERNFADVGDGGATTIREQRVFDYRMGSHTSRYASVNALLWAATGDPAALEKAYRSFNWATYMARSTGVVIDGPEVNNQWFTDGYGDYIRHFMVGVGALPQYAPAGQTHLLQSTATVRSITYGTTTSYTTFESRGTETIKTADRPTSVTVDGTTLAGSAWSYDTGGQMLTINRTTGTRVEIGYGSQPPANAAPTVRISAPSDRAEVDSGTAVNLTADASDADGTVATVQFFVDGTSAGTDATAPYGTTLRNLSAGLHLLTARATDDDGTTTTSATVRITISDPPLGPGPTRSDYDGDGDADIAVWRPSTGTWYIRGRGGIAYGVSTDKPVPADYDGNGTTDIAVWRPSSGTWYTRTRPSVRWGAAGDTPVSADYDGDGDADLAVWRPSTGRWYVRGTPSIAYGVQGDVPVPADYDGDGDADLAVWRPLTGAWYIRGRNGIVYGVSTDKPVPADYDGNGTTDIAIWRPSTTQWYVRGARPVSYGQSGDIPLTGR